LIRQFVAGTTARAVAELTGIHRHTAMLFFHKLLTEFFVFNAVLTRVRNTVQLIRSRPFDTSTEAGRVQERHRRIVLTAMAAMVAKILSVAAALITVPLTLHYLGIERYGMWMTISSLIAMLAFADLGIGNGLMNAVATAYGHDDQRAIHESISSATFILCVVALAIMSLFACCYSFVPWSDVFNVTSPLARREAGPAVAVLVACFSLAIPVSIIQRVQMGMQQGFVANLWQCAGSLLSLLGILLAIWLKTGLPILVLAFAGSPLIAALLNSIVYFVWLCPGYKPSWRMVSRRAMKFVADLGILFFILQIGGAIAFSSDNIIIAQMFGADAVAVYSVPQRLFSVIPMLLTMVLAPLWPAYGEAIAHGDHAWVKATFGRSLCWSIVLAAVISFGFVVFGRWIVHVWVGNAVAPTLALLLAMGVWQVAQASGGSIAMYLNGANVVKPQVVVVVLVAALSIVLKIGLGGYAGLPGIAWGATLGILLGNTPYYFYIAHMIYGRTIKLKDIGKWSN
jgi:O-antigen/teichoic acid export membrane protein